MSHLPGKFVWFEHAGADVARARAFYEPLFGWHVEAAPPGDAAYLIIHNAGQQIGALTTAPAGAPAAWRSYLSVTDVDQRYQVALEVGARGVMPPTDVDGIGRAATLVDPGGATVSLWRDAEGDRPDVEACPLGDWYWNELMTPDARQAVAFYTSVAGYSSEAMDIGQPAPYHVLSTGGRPRAGVFQSSDPALPSMWTPYVRVADCDATVAQALGLGATLVMPAADIAGVGRFALLVDPQGAAIAVIKGMPSGG